MFRNLADVRWLALAVLALAVWFVFGPRRPARNVAQAIAQHTAECRKCGADPEGPDGSPSLSACPEFVRLAERLGLNRGIPCRKF
jgi:hypothetical protein